jgi:SNF2 family DNA or RNA helicase
MLAELPEESHFVKTFKTPSTYRKTLKTRTTPDGEFLDTSGALCAELRRQCFTKDKQEWVKDFVENLGTNAVFFYNFIKTGDELEEVITKALPKGAKVWRIDGKRHEIPTEKTIGRYDIVICQWQSGSEALNFQFMNYWVAVELCYSYSTAIQARGRIKRIGQKKHMNYYYLLTERTIEQAILKCLKQKGEFSDEVWLAELKERKEIA